MTITINVEKDYYCSQKFWWLSVNLEKSETLSCCAATPTKINFDYLAQHPGELFNSPVLVSERQDMLNNKPVPSCASNCWQPEARDLTSRRLLMNSNQRTHVDVQAKPETLHIITGTNCNMTCVYCCKTYSSAWAQDIQNNGIYEIDTADDRFRLSSVDRVVMKLSQKQISQSSQHVQLLDEIKTVFEQNNLTNVVITGGEPFLYLGLAQLVSGLTNKSIPVRIWSGLGVDVARFAREAEKLSKFSNVEIVISAESTGQLYELVRYGNTWSRLQENIATLDRLGINYSFYCTLTNLTLLGIDQFISFIGPKTADYSLCTDPSFLSVNMLDPMTKQSLIDNFQTLPDSLQKVLGNDLSRPADSQQQLNLKTYLSEFARRRNLNLDFLPETFTKWLM
jgi:hypothetical protein